MVAGKSLSGKLRRAIGLAKSFLGEKLAEENESHEDFGKFDAEELYEFLRQTQQDYDQVKTQVDKIQGYEEEWNKLILQDASEVQEKTKYIEKYGSYMGILEEGRMQMKVLEDVYRKGWARLNNMDTKKAEEVFTPEELFTVKGEAVTTTRKLSGNVNKYGMEKLMNEQEYPIMESQEIPVSNVGPSDQQMLNNSQVMVTMSPFQFAMPQWKVPTFDGDYLAYYEFRQNLDSIMERMQLGDFEKLTLLKTAVTGEPAKLLKSLTVQKYQVAIDILELQYGGLLRHKHLLLQKLRNLPNITNSTSSAVLQDFYINAQMIFNELMSLGCEMDNLTTADTIENKLPFRVVKKAYSQECRDTPFTASELLQMVGKISRSESLLAAIKPSNDQRTTTMAVQNRHGKHSSNNHQKEKVKKPCSYCVEERMMHHSMDCRRYATNEERKTRAGQLKLCFKCLDSGHVARDCSWKCKECQGKHHFTMCHKREQQQPPKAGGQIQNGYQNQWKTNGNGNLQHQLPVRPTHGGGIQSSKPGPQPGFDDR